MNARRSSARDAARNGGAARRPRVAVFGPSPLLTVAVETRSGSDDDIHLHVGGQGVWVTRMAGELGADVVMCGFAGGESGALVTAMLAHLPGERRLTQTASATGCYVVDRRTGERKLLARQFSAPPSRHEVDSLVSATVAAALDSDVLVVCNPFPGDLLPLEVYGALVSDVRANGVPVVVDLSTPRLDSALEGAPELVKLNDWELAEYVCGPVSELAQMRAAAERLRAAGAGTVLVTRAGDPAYVLRGEGEWLLTPPRFERGSREGCGDSMMGGIAAAWACGRSWRDALMLGAAAGAANFLRHGLGSGSRAVIEGLLEKVELNEQVEAGR